MTSPWPIPESLANPESITTRWMKVRVRLTSKRYLLALEVLPDYVLLPGTPSECLSLIKYRKGDFFGPVLHRLNLRRYDTTASSLTLP